MKKFSLIGILLTALFFTSCGANDGVSELVEAVESNGVSSAQKNAVTPLALSSYLMFPVSHYFGNDISELLQKFNEKKIAAVGVFAAVSYMEPSVSDLNMSYMEGNGWRLYKEVNSDELYVLYDQIVSFFQVPFYYAGHETCNVYFDGSTVQVGAGLLGGLFFVVGTDPGASGNGFTNIYRTSMGMQFGSTRHEAYTLPVSQFDYYKSEGYILPTYNRP